jgi:ATP-binding cassette, subfamily B, bacterial
VYSVIIAIQASMISVLALGHHGHDDRDDEALGEGVMVAVVLQNTFLFSGTLTDLHRYGRREATDEVDRVAEAALATELAQEMPDEPGTQISADGVGLSDGQPSGLGSPGPSWSTPRWGCSANPSSVFTRTPSKVVVQAQVGVMEVRTVIMATHQPALATLATRSVHPRPCGVLDEPARHTPTRR